MSSESSSWKWTACKATRENLAKAKSDPEQGIAGVQEDLRIRRDHYRTLQEASLGQQPARSELRQNTWVPAEANIVSKGAVVLVCKHIYHSVEDCRDLNAEVRESLRRRRSENPFLP